MNDQDRMIAMKDVKFLVPATDIEMVFYAAFCHGLAKLEALSEEQRASLAYALESFRATYVSGPVGGTAFVTEREIVFIPARAVGAERPGEASFRVPLTEIVAIEVSRGLFNDALTVKTPKGRFELRAFRARGFAAVLARTWNERFGRLSASFEALGA